MVAGATNGFKSKRTRTHLTTRLSLSLWMPADIGSAESFLTRNMMQAEDQETMGIPKGIQHEFKSQYIYIYIYVCIDTYISNQTIITNHLQSLRSQGLHGLRAARLPLAAATDAPRGRWSRCREVRKCSGRVEGSARKMVETCWKKWWKHGGKRWIHMKDGWKHGGRMMDTWCFIQKKTCESEWESLIYWLVVWIMDSIFPFSWECHHPN